MTRLIYTILITIVDAIILGCAAVWLLTTSACVGLSYLFRCRGDDECQDKDAQPKRRKPKAETIDVRA